MCKKYIGFGKCSKSYIYILFAFILKTLDDNYFNYTSVSPESEIDFLGISPVLANHIIVQNFYKYISCIIGGILFKFIIRTNISEKTKQQDSKINKINFIISEAPKLLHYKSDIVNMPITEIIIVSIIYVIHFELLDILYTFKLYNLCFWSFEIIFVIFFIKRYFVIKFYNYQECSLLFMIIVDSILLIIASFYPVIEGKSGPKTSYEILGLFVDKNYFLFILIILIINSVKVFISYARVRAKVLIDFKYISPYTILIFIGIFGLLFTSIELIFGTLFKCENPFDKFCVVESFDKTKYFDNVIIYFNKLGEKGAKEFCLEIFFLLPIFIIINFFELVCEFLIIIHLNPIFVLIQNNFAYGVNYLLYVVIKSNTSKQKDDILKQFFFNETAEITAIICYMIYLQIIELRFCGLDTYLDRNLLLLSTGESEEGITEVEQEDLDIDKIDEYSLYSDSTIYN